MALDTVEIRSGGDCLTQRPDELAAVPGGWAEREWTIEGHVFRLYLPASPDAFLDDHDVQSAFDKDGYMPYWAYLWPSSLKMAATVLQAEWPAQARVLELGAGIGLVGMAGLVRGLQVTFSDYEPKAVELALANARRAGLTSASGCVLDWRHPHAESYPFVWGCDLLYDVNNHRPLLELTQQILTVDGMGWFADGGRAHAEHFWKLLPQYGFRGNLFDEEMRPLSGPHVGRYQLIEIRHAC